MAQSSSFLWDKYKRYPIHVVLGDLGSGKSLFLTYMAYLAWREGITNIFANFHLTGIPYHYLRYYKVKDNTGKVIKNVNDLLTGKSEDGTPIKNGILLWDEPQSTGIHSHHFFSDETEELQQLVSQIRKDDVAVIFATQRDNFIASQIRQLIVFVYEIHPTETKGVIDIIRRDLSTYKIIDPQPIRKDLRIFYPFYNTKEKIGVKPDEN